MATIVNTFVNELGETINVYESGAHYNVTRKHLVKAPESAMITKENAWKFKEQLAEKKREALVKGAARVLERSGEWETPNALDMVEAIGEAVMLKALNPDNPKQVDAARFMMTEAGLSETQTKTSEEAQQFADLASAAGQLVAFLRDLHQPRDVIDGNVTDVKQIPADTDIRNE
jgi:hypothetical protein